MKRIEVDFNVGQNEEGLMRLSTYGALESLQKTGAQIGDFVLLQQDDDIGVGALLLKKGEQWFARFNWDDIFDLEKNDDGKMVKKAVSK